MFYKKYILTISLLLWIASGMYVKAQRLDYKDIYPLIEARNFRDAVPRLREFLLVEMDHPSANFQLALIYEERMLSYHPILQYRPAMKNAESAKMYFIKSYALIDEKEIKKNAAML